jgi:hypothetical protein
MEVYKASLRKPNLTGCFDKIDHGLKLAYGFFKERPKDTLAIASIVTVEAALWLYSSNLYEPVRYIVSRATDISLGVALGRLSK